MAGLEVEYLAKMARQLNFIVSFLEEKMERWMSDISATQADLNTDAAAITAAVNSLAASQSNIAAELNALQAANPTVDTSGLDAAVASLGNAVSTIATLAPAQAATPDATAPVVVNSDGTVTPTPTTPAAS